MPQIRILSTLLFTLLLWSGIAGTASAASYPFCVKYEAQSADSGVGEDYWQTNLNIQIPAYGVRVRFQKGLSNIDVDTNPATGCGTLTTALTPPFNITVYAYITDDDGNFTRFHDGGWWDFSDYPGFTYSWYFPNQTMTTGATKFINAGSYSRQATTMAAAAFAHYRYDFGSSGNQTHISHYNNADNGPDCFKNSAHYCDADGTDCSYDDLDERAYIRLDDGANGCAAAGDSGSRSKFVALHEIGHTEIMLHMATLEPLSTFNSGYTPPASAPGSCTASSYSMGSWEYNVVGFREGFAHFYAIRVFNDPDGGDDATMGWLNGAVWNVETNSTNAAGGRLVNNCYGGVNLIANGTSTNIDWARTFWDWHAPSAVAAYTIRDIYDRVIDRHYAGTATLTNYNYYSEFYNGVGALGSSAGVKDAWVQDACWNGIDRQAGFLNNCCYSGAACTY